MSSSPATPWAARWRTSWRVIQRLGAGCRPEKHGDITVEISRNSWNGGFLSHSGTPNHHPFLDGDFPLLMINQPFLDTPQFNGKPQMMLNSRGFVKDVVLQNMGFLTQLISNPWHRTVLFCWSCFFAGVSPSSCPWGSVQCVWHNCAMPQYDPAILSLDTKKTTIFFLGVWNSEHLRTGDGVGVQAKLWFRMSLLFMIVQRTSQRTQSVDPDWGERHLERRPQGGGPDGAGWKIALKMEGWIGNQRWQLNKSYEDPWYRCFHGKLIYRFFLWKLLFLITRNHGVF